MKRKIFPALLSNSEHQALVKLSANSRCSQSAMVRGLILDAPLAAMCRTLIAELLRDKTFRHRALLIREIKSFVRNHGGGVPEVERLLQEHGR